MKTFFKKFRKSENGAITIEWVVLFTGMFFLGVSLLASSTEATDSVGSTIAQKVSEH